MTESIISTLDVDDRFSAHVTITETGTINYVMYDTRRGATGAVYNEGPRFMDAFEGFHHVTGAEWTPFLNRAEEQAEAMGHHKAALQLREQAHYLCPKCYQMDFYGQGPCARHS